jgi:TolB-like protein
MCPQSRQCLRRTGENMRLLLLCLIGMFLTVPAAPVSAAELDSKLESAAAKLSAAAEARGLVPSTLAVFPFQADKKLSDKKVNFAVSEILTKNFLKLGKFKVVERAQLEEVMREQKLGLSGAVDSKTAADIGKLAGAKLLLLGNVIQMGKSYQLTAKLVDAETGEMIASEIAEVPVKTFDEDADRYLVLVPDTQSVGFFLGMGYGFASTAKMGPQSFETLTLNPTNAELAQSLFSFGVRYWVKPRWMAQLDFSSVGTTFGSGTNNIYTTDAVLTGPSGRLKTGYTGFMLRASLDRTTKLSRPLTWHYGAGAAFYSLDTLGVDKLDSSTYGLYSVYMNTEFQGDFVTPFLRTGIEWRPQARFGWSLFGNYNLSSRNFVQSVNVVKAGSDTQHKLELWKTSIPQFYIDSSVALYF